ncbi:MAG: Jag N-terminal domain-containing protein, partial [Chloroflexota bacterium]
MEEEKKTTLEVIGPSVEEAIENGLDQLGLPRNAVDVEVLDEGQSGFLGIGSRQVRVRLTLQHAYELAESQKNQAETEESLPVNPEDMDELEIAKVKAKEIVEKLLQ